MLENVNKYGVVEVNVEGEGVVWQIVKQGNEWRYMLKVGRDMSYCSKEDFMDNLEWKWEELRMEWEEEDILEVNENMGLAKVEEEVKEEEVKEEEVKEEEVKEEEVKEEEVKEKKVKKAKTKAKK